MKIHFAFACVIGLWPTGKTASAQLPLGSIQVEEVAIPASIKTTIASDLAADSSLVHCYRIYICMLEPLWELQAIFGGNGFSDWTLNTTSAFYQHPFGSETGDGINAGLFPIFPELQFDSWFTINADVSADPPVIFTFDGPPQTFSTWEASGGNYTSSSPYGSAISNVVGYPNTSGMPDAFGRILVAQLTTAGTFSGIFNLQFRRLNADGSIFLPVTVSNVVNIPYNSTLTSGACSLLLPIHILRFEGWSAGEKNILSFELDVSQHSVWHLLHSSDTENWETIGEGSASLNPDPFTFEHAHVRAGLHYYQVNVTNDEAEEIASDIITILTPGDMQIYPNPFSDHICITSSSALPKEIDVYSSTGSQIAHYMSVHAGETIDTRSWPAGLYFIQVKAEDQEAKVFKAIRL